MELLRSSVRKSWKWRPSDLSRVLSLYSTAASTSSLSSSSATAASLFRRISPAGNPNASVVPILDQWIQEGHHILRDELQFLVKRLKLYRRYSHALQVSEWGEKMYPELSPRDMSFRLELISSVHGLDQAEKYFDSLPPSSRNSQVYYSLLQSYAHTKSLEKAEDLMSKLIELGFARTSFPFNVMMKLYCDLKRYEKLDDVMQQMNVKGIWWNNYTCNIRLSAYAADSDIAGMERFLGKMERDPVLTVDWVNYMVLANGYLKVGLVDKCVLMLKRVEQLAHGKSKKRAYHYLLTVYGRAKRKDEVYRLWALYKSWWDVRNNSYLYMVSSLVKADELQGAEEIVEEYNNSKARVYDYRILNVLIRAYGRKGDFERAEALVRKGMEHEAEPPMSTWDILAAGYCLHNRMEDAMRTFKKGFVAERKGWKVNAFYSSACIEYLKQKGEVAELEEFTGLLSKCVRPSETQLLDSLADSGVVLEFSDQEDEDDAEIEKIMCPTLSSTPV